MSSKKCCVSECLNSYPKAPKGTTWHPFPKNKDLAEEWMAKIDKTDEKRKRNCLVCSDHFDKKNFKTSSLDLRNRRGILSSSAVPSIFKKKNDQKNVNYQVDVSSYVGISVLPLDVWEKIFSHLSLNDLISLSSTCKYSQKIVQTLLNKVDFSNYYPFNWNGFLSYTVSTTCTSINLNHCYWLKPSEILKMISKTNLEHLHIIECQVNSECIEAICDLELTSLSISYETDWRSFFRTRKTKRKTNVLIRGFRELKNLEIFYKQLPSQILIEIYNKVLVHCKKLEHLKVFQCPSQATLSTRELKNEAECDRISPEPTVIPELKSLVINLQTVWFRPNVAKLIALILKDKVVPLQHVDFGHQIGYLFEENILPNPKIMLDKSTLAISSLHIDLNFWLNFPSVRELISQPDYKSVEIRNAFMNGFSEFAQKIASNSGETLNKILMKHRYGFYGFLDGLQHIAVNCSQITVFDFSGHAFDYNEELFYISNVMVRKHKALLNALVNLKNLKKLAIPASILHCKYYKSNGVKLDKALPFWKVTLACESLTEIRITFGSYVMLSPPHQIHESSLYCIASCAQLRTLHLTRFQIQCAENSKFVLSRISKSCSQLRELYIRDIQSLSNHSDIFSKNMKIISSFGMEICSKAFLNGLSRCQNLEKLFLDEIYIEEEDFRSLEDILRKLKNLKTFVVRHCVRRGINRELKKSRNERLNNALKSIADERPGFFYTLKGFDRNRIPNVQLGAFYLDGLDH